MDNTEQTSFAAVREFVIRQKAAGRYNAATARNLEAACAHVEPILEPGNNTIGYVREHLDDVVRRYGNLNQKVGQASLKTYRARLHRAIEDFIGHRTDPQWRPPSRAKRSTQLSTDAASPAAPNNPGIPTGAPVALRHRLPLRSDFDVEIVLPRNLSGRETKRILNWISSLSMDEDPLEGIPQ